MTAPGSDLISLLPDSAAVSSSGQLEVGGCNMTDLAKEFGTPLFVYDEDHIRTRCRQAVQAFPDGAVYASKSFMCLAVARLVAEEGMKIDVASGGEMYVALSAGVPAKNLVFHGNNKSEHELFAALKAGIGKLVIDSFEELERIERISKNLSAPPVNALVRITPGVSAHTHEFLSTGQEDTKFGFTVSSGLAQKAVEKAQACRAINFQGIHAHIGSQIFNLENLELGVKRIAEFAVQHEIEELCIGGGLGVAYLLGETAPDISEWADSARAVCAEAGLKSSVKITAEPGRSVIAGAALTLYRVGVIKELQDIRTYVSVDGGMSDNPRPALYGSGYETFLPRDMTSERNREITLVGMHCETGDTLVQSGWVPDNLAVGDILATPVTGAYGHSMGSNYNKVLRPAVVFVKEGKAEIIIQREQYEDLVRRDMGPRAVLDESLGFSQPGQNPDGSVA